MDKLELELRRKLDRLVAKATGVPTWVARRFEKLVEDRDRLKAERDALKAELRLVKKEWGRAQRTLAKVTRAINPPTEEDRPKFRSAKDRAAWDLLEREAAADAASWGSRAITLTEELEISDIGHPYL